MKTLQELFSQAYLGILAQGGQSSDGLGCCMYRGSEGRKCAVGHLRPSEFYHRGLEGKSVEYSPGALKSALIQAGIDMEDKPTKALLEKTQIIHDGPALVDKLFIEILGLSMSKPASGDELFIKRFKSSMSELATEYGLEVPE